MSRNSSDDESAHNSGEEGSEISDGHSESGAESESEASETQGFLDDMAEEGDETEQSDEDDDDEDLTPSFPFPQFLRLPIELRHKIWEFFCPELTSRALTLDFNLTQFQGTTSRTWHLTDGMALYDQTEAIRAVLAVHQESRALALKRFPDPIPIMAEDADAIIRFHPEKDVPILNGLGHLEEVESADQCRLPECFSTLKHFAIGGWELRDRFYPGVIPILIHKFRSLEALFLCTTSISVQRKKLVWCTSGLVHQHDVETFERSPAYGEDFQCLYCWPDLENHADFARFQIPQGFADSVLAADARILQEKGIGVWPMIAFENRKGLRRYESLYSYKSDGFDDGSESESSEDSGAEEESESGTDLDQYESDGIDDGEIEHFDPDEDDEISIDGDAEDDASGARFSSPEPEHELVNRTRKRRVVEDSDDDEEGDEVSVDEDADGRGSEAQFSSPEPEPEAELVNRSRKRRIVEDSDEEEEDEQPVAKRSRMSRAVASDSEDEAPTQPDKRGRASRIIVSDSESDDDKETEQSVTKHSKRKTVVISDSEDGSDESESEGSGESEDEESESEDEEKSPPRMSLAERLRLHRRDNPVDDDEPDRSEGDNIGDDSEDEEDESDDDRRGGASMFFDGMAEEEDEEDDYDESLL